MPKHIAVIMDGNGRWAAKRGLPRREGHTAGTEAAKTVTTACRELGVQALTLYTFSKENWKRPKDEVRFLFDLLVKFMNRELDNLIEQDIRLEIVGDEAGLPLTTREAIRHAKRKTAKCSSMVLNLALNYSGRDEIVQAVQGMLRQGIKPEDVTEETISQYLFTAHVPDPDLVIRTSGELRLSNFLLYQTAYAELYFTDVLWPDFDKAELHKAVAAFEGRKRRFGMTGEQLEETVADPTNT